MSEHREFHYRLPHRIGGWRPGSHRGASLGGAQEFVSHMRLYDRADPRRLDLRASLRNIQQEWLVRVHRQRSSIPVYAVVDVSASMSFGSPRSKLEVAADFIEALGQSAFRAGDSLGMLAFDVRERMDLFVPARVGRGMGDTMAGLLRDCSRTQRGVSAAVNGPRARSGRKGLRVARAGAEGLRTARAGADGLRAASAGADGLRAAGAGADGLRASSAGAEGLRTASAGADGLRASSAGADGLRASSAGADGLRAASTGSDGLRASSAGAKGLRTTSAGAESLRAASAGVSGLHGTRPNADSRHGGSSSADRQHGASSGGKAPHGTRSGGEAAHAASAGIRALQATIEHLAGKRGLVFLVSDFHWPLTGLGAVLDSLTHSFVVPLVLWDPAEIEPPTLNGLMQLRDMESGAQRSVWMRPRMRGNWRKSVEARRDELTRLFAEHATVPFYVTGSFDSDALSRYFFELAP